MARTEGRNQPDLLTFLHKRDGAGPAPSAPVAAPMRTPAAAPGIPRSSHPILAGGPPSRSSSGRSPLGNLKKEVWILIALGVVVLGVTAALLVRYLNKPVVPDTSAPRVAPPARRTASTPSTPAAWTPPVLIPGEGKRGAKTFWTLVLATYPVAQEAKARLACQQVRARGKDCADVFLYRTAAKVEVCLGRFDPDRNIKNNPKVDSLSKQLGRDFPGIQQIKKTVLQP